MKPKNAATSTQTKRGARSSRRGVPKDLREKRVTPAVATHVLVRVRSEDGQTITAHKNMIATKGSAVLGKIGQALGAAFIDALNHQIELKVPTYLFLTTREGWNGPYVTYQCRLKHVDSTLPQAMMHLVPKYYASSYNEIRTWFEISTLDKMAKTDMNRIIVTSSGRTIMSVIKSTAAVFRVSMKASA